MDGNRKSRVLFPGACYGVFFSVAFNLKCLMLQNKIFPINWLTLKLAKSGYLLLPVAVRVSIPSVVLQRTAKKCTKKDF